MAAIKDNDQEMLTSKPKLKTEIDCKKSMTKKLWRSLAPREWKEIRFASLKHKRQAIRIYSQILNEFVNDLFLSELNRYKNLAIFIV